MNVMNKIKLNLFEIFSLSWIAIALSGLFWALLGLFHIQLIILDAIAVIGIFWYLIKKKKIEISPLAKSSVIVLYALFAIGIFLSLTTTPTIFGGRDEGSYSTAAIMLSQDHKLTHQSPLVTEFFKIYEPGKALNFPGFDYTPKGELKTQFPPGFISWIARWYSVFGLDGIKFVNLFPFITFVFSFFLICKKLFKKYTPSKNLRATNLLPANRHGVLHASYALLFFLTCFPLIIFYKFTLSEIFFGSLAWFTLFLLFRYFENKTLAKYYLMIFPASLMLFVRIESAAVVFMLLFILILKDFNRLSLAKYQLMFAILGIIFIASLVSNSNFFVDSFKNIAEPFLESGEKNSAILSDDLKNLYILKVFINYNFFPFLIAGLFMAFYLLKKKNYFFLIPIIYFCPTLVYLVDANVSLDHPWLLRRFLFSIIPLFILYGLLFILCPSKKTFLGIRTSKLVFILSFFVILLNISLFFPKGKAKNNLLVFGQNSQLLEQTEIIAQNFSPDDLVLFSQQSSGNGWSLMSEPLRTIFRKQAIYFFNPNDLEKINKSRFKNIYLVTSESDQELYSQLPKEKIANYDISNRIIFPSKNPFAKPDIIETKTNGIIFQLN